MSIHRWIVAGSMSLGISMAACPVFAAVPAPCTGLPTQANLQTALEGAVGVAGNGGLGFNMWATIVAVDGTVCAVAFSSTGSYKDQWLASRVISAQKANTANGLSLGEGSNLPATSLFRNGLALSTANLYSAVQPGGSLYGLQHSNPVDASIAYLGDANSFGTANDPLVGLRIGGINVFGGGLVLMSTGGKRVGGVGVSGDTSCTDHMVAWRVRKALNLDDFGPKGAPVGGVSGDSQHPDNIIFDIREGGNGGMLNPVGSLSMTDGGFGHPTCINNPDPATLPVVHYE
jgi:uncharacterized protein GlcG (DUF336 family)